MTDIESLADYCNQLLDAHAVKDYCPNGLQVDAGRPVARLVSGVTASEALIDAAVAAGADALLVHHGYFWKGEPAPLVGIKGRRIGKLLRAGISLLAYHLPLDRHPSLGNNIQLGKRLGMPDGKPMDQAGLLWGAVLPQALTAAALKQRIDQALSRKPLHLPGGKLSIRRVAWCSGAAQGSIVQAAEAGFDAYISGEVSEQTLHQAAELGIHYFAAGHHATERYGVQALGAVLAERFDLVHQYVEIANPV